MLARHAESLFWMGRYLERAADSARMLDVTYHGLLESAPAEARTAWFDLLRVLHLDGSFKTSGHEVTAASVSEFLVFGAGNPGSILNVVGKARENARSVRELISTEVWEAVNTFYLELHERDLRSDVDQQPYELYGLVKRRCQAVSGTAVETMPRNDGWRFLMLGWMLERAEMTCRLLNVRYTQPIADAPDGLGSYHHWMSVLRSASAAEAYRQAYTASMNRADVAEFLMMSRTFPRSVLYCLESAEDQLRQLSGPTLSQAQRLLGRVRADIEFRDPHELQDEDLSDFLEGVQFSVRGVAELIAAEFFRHEEVIELHSLRAT